MRRDKYSLSLFIAVGLVLLLVASSLSGTRPVTAGRKHFPVDLTDIPILNYHKIDDSYNHCLSLTSDEFTEQMSFLHENGYHSITPDQLMAYLKYGKSLPDKPVLITFDDGYADNYANAYPILKRYGFTATIFIVTGLVGKDTRYLSWEQARQMQKDGFVFGSHTVSHTPLTDLNEGQIHNELTESQRVIEQELGVRPYYFAYPTGTYSQSIERLVKKAGYKAAFTIRYGQVGIESDLYALERIPIFHGNQSYRNFFIRFKGAPILERLGIIRN